MSEEQNIPVQPASPHIQQNNDTMEVHKHPHHVTHKKKWGEYLLEFFMLFIAVTAGFFAENYREHLSNNVKEREYMHSLIADLKSDTALIGKCIKYNTFNYMSDSSLIDLINSPTDSLSFDNISDKFLRAGSFWVEFNDPTTFELLKSTGDFRLIKNKLVLEDISRYYQRVSRDRIFRDEIQSQIQITYNMADKVFDQHRFIHNRNQFTKSITSNHELIKEYSNKLYTQLGEFKEFIRQIGILKQKATEFISLIKTEYHLETD